MLSVSLCLFPLVTYLIFIEARPMMVPVLVRLRM